MSSQVVFVPSKAHVFQPSPNSSNIDSWYTAAERVTASTERVRKGGQHGGMGPRKRTFHRIDISILALIGMNKGSVPAVVPHRGPRQVEGKGCRHFGNGEGQQVVLRPDELPRLRPLCGAAQVLEL